MIKFYKEKNGDYLCIDSETWKHYKRIYPNRERIYEGRATCIEGNHKSVNTTSISSGHLKKCKRIEREKIPENWISVLV